MSRKIGFWAMTPWIVAGFLVILALGFSPAPTLAADASPNAFGRPTEAVPNPSANINPTRGTRPTGWVDQTRSEVLARNGVVATSEPLAAQAGLEILRQGGNAVDAAVATMAMLALVEPNSTGLGAEMFAIIYDAKTKRLYEISANGPSPHNYTPEIFAANGFDLSGPPYGTAPSIGIFSGMVPGGPDGWDKMLKRFGTMTFKEVLEPARKYAFEGFPVHEVLANSFRGSKNNLCATGEPYDMDTKAVYCADGDVPGLYEIFKNPDMGHTFEVLQKKGINAFYKGEIAKAIVKKANSVGVIVPGGGPFWTMKDLKNYEARWERPLMTKYHGYNIWETPPPSQAWAALEMLNLLEVCAEVKPFDLGALGRPNSLFTHIEVEAKKLAYSDLLRWNADPDFSDIKNQIDKFFNNKDYALGLCKLFEGDLSTWPRPDPDPHPPVARPADVLGNLDGGTIFGVSADRWGNMVSFVNSVYTSWGSKVTIPGYGFQLSSRGGMFNFDPDHPNTLAGGKRPFITIIAAFITKDKDGYPDGEPIMAFGNMGGGTQPQAHAQHVVNMIDLGFNVQATGDAARFDHDQGTGVQSRDNLRMDYYLYDAVNADLTAWGHTTQRRRGLAGGYQGVLFERDPNLPEPWLPSSDGHHGKHGKKKDHHYKDYDGPVNGTYRAGSELRKDGAAVGW